MSVAQIKDALKLVDCGEVILEAVTDFALYFKVGEYDVRYDGRKQKWNCTCIFASIWSKQKTDCKHIKSCKLWLIKQRRDWMFKENKGDVQDNTELARKGIFPRGLEVLSP